MMETDPFQFCPLCAEILETQPIADKLRKRCPSCHWIHYRNPTAGVAVILLTEEGLWLGRRRSGGWCIPCGHVEWDETIQQAAVREALEETGLQVELQEVYAVLSNFHDSQGHTVGIWYRAYAKNITEARPGGDLVEVRPFPLSALPELIFPTDIEVVRRLQAQSPPSKPSIVK